jgi:polyisoprenoid-binding protein YceI
MAPRPRTLVLGALLLALAGIAAGFVYFLIDDGSAPAPADVPQAGAEPLGQTADGPWVVRGGRGTYAGYRVDEEYLSVGVRTAVGRTPRVRGSVAIAGGRITAASLRADLRLLRSDKPGRDDALRTRGIETDAYPRATFRTLRGPVTLTARGAAATGRLELHGRSATVPVTLRAARVGRTLVLAGSVPIRFARFGIDPPSTAGIVTVRDHGVLEFRLVLARDG